MTCDCKKQLVHGVWGSTLELNQRFLLWNRGFTQVIHLLLSWYYLISKVLFCQFSSLENTSSTNPPDQVLGRHNTKVLLFFPSGQPAPWPLQSCHCLCSWWRLERLTEAAQNSWKGINSLGIGFRLLWRTGFFVAPSACTPYPQKLSNCINVGSSKMTPTRPPTLRCHCAGSKHCWDTAASPVFLPWGQHSHPRTQCSGPCQTRALSKHCGLSKHWAVNLCSLKIVPHCKNDKSAARAAPASTKETNSKLLFPLCWDGCTVPKATARLFI